MGMMGKWTPGEALPSLTKQASKDETDINMILQGYSQTGVLPFQDRAALAQYADVSEIGSFAECVTRVRDVERAFAGLPAAIRDRFANDPILLMEAVEIAEAGDPGAIKELTELGILTAPSSPATAPGAAPAQEAPGAAVAGDSPSKT